MRKRTQPAAKTKSIGALRKWFQHSAKGLRHWRPRTRADCAEISRPCPYVGCRYHLAQDVTKAGGLKTNFPFLLPWEMPCSCALDVAEGGERSLEEIGELMNLSRERVRQLEARALAKLEPLFDAVDVVG